MFRLGSRRLRLLNLAALAYRAKAGPNFADEQFGLFERRKVTTFVGLIPVDDI